MVGNGFRWLAVVAALALLAPGGPGAAARDGPACSAADALADAALGEAIRHAGRDRPELQVCLAAAALVRLGALREEDRMDAVLVAAAMRSTVGEAAAGEPFAAAARIALSYRLAGKLGVVDAPERPELEHFADLRTRAPAPPAVGSTAGLSRPPGAEPAAVPPGSAEPALGVLAAGAHQPRHLPPRRPPDRRRSAAAGPPPAAPDGPAGGGPGCLDPAAARDPDVRRNRGAIARDGLCLSALSVREGAVEVRFVSVANPRHPDGPVWFLPHDNEEEAFDAAVHAVGRYGGRMVAVDGDETRFYRALDLNRTFALTAADARPCAIRRPMPAFTRFVMALFDGRPEVLSIHNNTRGGSVSVTVSDGKATGFPVRGEDPDNLVFVAGTEAPVPGRPPAAVRAIGGAGLNVVYERVDRGNSDCSLSNHVVLNDGRPYYNVEAVHGSREQARMVDRLMAVLGHAPVAGG